MKSLVREAGGSYLAEEEATLRVGGEQVSVAPLWNEVVTIVASGKKVNLERRCESIIADLSDAR